MIGAVYKYMNSREEVCYFLYKNLRSKALKIIWQWTVGVSQNLMLQACMNMDTIIERNCLYKNCLCKLNES